MHNFLVVGGGILIFLIALALSNAFWSPRDLQTTSPGGRFVSNLVASGFIAYLSMVAIETYLHPKPAELAIIPSTQAAQQESATPLSDQRPASSPAVPAPAPESAASFQPSQTEHSASQPETSPSVVPATQEAASSASPQSAGPAQ